jgi:fructose-1,6-bisphosphatase II
MSTREWDIPGVSGHLCADERDTGRLDQTLALELVRVTEAAAIAAGRWVGRDTHHRGKTAAVNAMRELIMSVPMRGVVVLGDGEPVLVKGDDVGYGDGPVCDVGISAGDGALSPARDVPGSLAAIVVAEPGALYDPSPGAGMDKLAVGPDCVDVVDIRRPVAENLRAVARAKGVRASDVVVAVLNRTRHRELVHDIREAGARVHLLEGGDIAGAIAVASPESPVDLLLGTGTAADGVIAAAALSGLGGAVQARLRPADSTLGAFDTVLHTEDLVGGERVVFCASGVTSSELLTGVQHRSGRTITASIVVCSTPETVRMVRSEHRDGRWHEPEARRFA